MASIVFVSGACGCGKSTFADAYAQHLMRQKHKTCYVIHGDDFHRGFVEPEDKGDFFVNGQASDPVLWEDILRFNWDCIMAAAERALQQHLDVVIDYVIEDELPRVRSLAERYDAPLYYIVLTADAEEIERRIRSRGDVDLMERALFLKHKLETMPENQGHLYNNTGKTPDDEIREIDMNRYIVVPGSDTGLVPDQEKEYAIRNVTIGDYDRIYDLWNSTEQSRRALNPVDDSREGIARYLRRNPGTCFAATQGERIIGVILTGHDGRRGIIHHMCVHPDFRRRGVAARLVSAAEKALKQEGIQKVFGLVFVDNAAANAFWERQGYTLRTNLNYRNKSLNERIPTGE